MNTKIQSLRVMENAKINNSFSHAYLFFGEQGVDVFAIALEAIKIMICEEDKKCLKSKTIEELNYPDLLFVNPENNLITKESIVSTMKIMSNTSLVSNKKKILLIKDIDLGNKYSLNSLLKYIEEPSKNTHIIMTTNRIDLLLPTIKSRAQNIMVKRQTTDQIIEDLLVNKIENKYIRLFANIFPNANKVKEMNAKIFNKTYSDVLNALKLGLDNPGKMKMELSNTITKDNILYAINILEYFYYQIQTIVDDKYPLFPDSDKLINKYKKCQIDYSGIQMILSV
jgi:DNA polymerase-3 subunit delta'